MASFCGMPNGWQGAQRARSGRLDLSGPHDIAWHIAQAWPDSEFVVIDEAGHSSGDPGMSEALVVATDRFASLP